MVLMIFMFFVIVVLAVAVSIIAYRHGFSCGYETGVADERSSDIALLTKERELYNAKAKITELETETSRQAIDIAAQNNFNLGLSRKITDLTARLNQAIAERDFERSKCKQLASSRTYKKNKSNEQRED